MIPSLSLSSPPLAHFSTAIRWFKHGLTNSKRETIILSRSSLEFGRAHAYSSIPPSTKDAASFSRSVLTTVLLFSRLFLPEADAMDVPSSAAISILVLLQTLGSGHLHSRRCLCATLPQNAIIPKIPSPYCSRWPWKNPDVGFFDPPFPLLSPSEILSRASSPTILIPRHFPRRRICISVNLDANVVASYLRSNSRQRGLAGCINLRDRTHFLSSSPPPFFLSLSHDPFYLNISLCCTIYFFFPPLFIIKLKSKRQ